MTGLHFWADGYWVSTMFAKSSRTASNRDVNNFSFPPAHQGGGQEETPGSPPGVPRGSQAMTQPRWNERFNRFRDRLRVCCRDWHPCHVRISCFGVSVITQSVFETRTFDQDQTDDKFNANTKSWTALHGLRQKVFRCRT